MDSCKMGSVEEGKVVWWGGGAKGKTAAHGQHVLQQFQDKRPTWLLASVPWNDTNSGQGCAETLMMDYSRLWKSADMHWHHHQQ